jgi:hypothetical protein
MQIDVTGIGVEITALVVSGFIAGKPEDTGEDPIASLRLGSGKCSAPDFPCGLTGFEHRIRRHAVTNACRDVMSTPRRTFAALLLTGSVAGSRNRKLSQYSQAYR